MKEEDLYHTLVRVVLLKPVRISSDGSIGDRPNKEVSAYGFSIFFSTTHFGHASGDGHDDACGVAGGGAGAIGQAQSRKELERGVDITRSAGKEEQGSMVGRFRSDERVITKGDVIIIAVPTPINGDLTPDLEPLKEVAVTVSRNVKKGALVVVESTVYPGVTESVFGPIIEQESGLKQGKDFHLGYAPERINPGDSHHTIEKITKVVAGEDSKVTELMALIYGMITGGAMAPKSEELPGACDNFPKIGSVISPILILSPTLRSN